MARRRSDNTNNFISHQPTCGNIFIIKTSVYKNCIYILGWALLLRGEAAQIWASIIKPLILPGMDEGTLKTPIPKSRLYWSFLFGVVRHTVCIYCTFCLGWGGGVREKVEGQKYTSIVPSSMGVTVHKRGTNHV
jgi:hypothetical protein